MGFKSFLKSRASTADPSGDFVADALADAQLPRIDSWEKLHRHLMERGAVPEAIDAAKEVWEEYKASVI